MKKTFKMSLCALFCALVVVMTIVPYTGYIQYAPLAIEITTLHVPVIIAAVLLGPAYGSLVGGVWGIACVIRAITNPLWVEFGFANPLISLVPRIIVGLVAASVFVLLKKCKCNKVVASVVSAVLGTLTNTVLVLGALTLFGGMQGLSFAEYFNQVLMTLIGINGIIEMVLAAVVVPLIYTPLSKILGKRA